MADEEDDIEQDGYDNLEDVYDDSDDNLELDNVRLNDDDDSNDDSDDNNGSVEENKKGDKVDFDKSLPSSHTYLGDEMDDVGGRTLMEDDNIVTIPLLSFPNLLLVPGQMLPLQFFQPQLVSMVKNILEKDKTFGVVKYEHNVLEHAQDPKKYFTGTTCEIFSFKEEIEGSITYIMIKAMARKRFQVISLRRQVDGTRIGTVRILPDIMVSAYPSHALPHAVNRDQLVTSPRRAMEKLTLVSGKKIFPSCSTWPVWVYELYNPYLIMTRIKLELKSWNENLNIDDLSLDPTEFSYWVTHNLPLDNRLRNQLLNLDCPIQRLQRQLKILQKYGIMICQDCECTIADKKDMFCMSLGGPMSAYVNPQGFVHETVTFYKAKGLRLRGGKSTQHSWFPGYAWTIAECKHCGNHMGWKFTAVNKKLVPAKFWGLTRASLQPSLKKDEENDSEMM